MAWLIFKDRFWNLISYCCLTNYLTLHISETFEGSGYPCPGGHILTQLSLLWVRTIHSIHLLFILYEFLLCCFLLSSYLKVGVYLIFIIITLPVTSEVLGGCVCLCVLVAQLCLTLCDPVDSCPPGSSVHGIAQARVLEWVAIPFSRGSSWPWDQTWVSCTAGRFLTVWATKEASYFRRFCSLCRIWMCLCLWSFLTKLPGVGF